MVHESLANDTKYSGFHHLRKESLFVFRLIIETLLRRNTALYLSLMDTDRIIGEGCDDVSVYSYLMSYVDISCPMLALRSRDSAVCIETGYGLDGRGVRVPSSVEVKNVLFSTSSRSVLGPTQPPFQ
jgi:hypothetical protein